MWHCICRKDECLTGAQRLGETFLQASQGRSAMKYEKYDSYVVEPLQLQQLQGGKQVGNVRGGLA